MGLAGLMLLVVVAGAAAGGTADQEALDDLFRRLIAETSAALQRNAWTTYFLPEINLSMIIMERGVPTEGNFKANGGSLRDLSTLRVAGHVQRLSKGEDSLQLQVPLDFGQFHAKYNQYFFKYGLPTYVGTFTTTFNKTFASAVLTLSGSGTACNVTVDRASMDTFGQTSTDIKTPPALVNSLDKVEEAVVGAFFRNLPVLDEFLVKALKEASTRINLCSILQQ